MITDVIKYAQRSGLIIINTVCQWEYFQKVYAADKSYGELRLYDKLTEEHIDGPN